jgi:hypothetical protein
MKKEDDKQTSFDFNRHCALAIKNHKLDLNLPANVVRIVFSKKSRSDGHQSGQDVDAINRRILDLVK